MTSQPLAKKISYCLYAIIISGTITVLNDFMVLAMWFGLPHTASLNIATIHALDHPFAHFLQATRATFTFLLLVSMPMVARWLYVSSKINHLSDAKLLRFTPRQAWSWYLVPVAHYIMPYFAMIEIYKASFSYDRWQTRKVPLLFPIWWGSFCAWITLPIVIFIIQISNLVQVRSLEDLMNYDGGSGFDFSIFLDISAVVSTICLSLIISKVTRNQAGKRYKKAYTKVID